jgi:hypothetical protein
VNHALVDHHQPPATPGATQPHRDQGGHHHAQQNDINADVQSIEAAVTSLGAAAAAIQAEIAALQAASPALDLTGLDKAKDLSGAVSGVQALAALVA